MRVFAIIQLDAASTIDRLRVDVPKLLDIVKRGSPRSEQAFRSNDGLLFAFALETERSLAEIRSAVTGSSYFLNGDSIIIVEVGADFSSSGFSRLGTWLQRTATGGQSGNA